MATAMEAFTDSYLRKLKRPELRGVYEPDQNYGANMLFRSNETNPWSGRDQSNSKFGFLGGTAGVNKNTLGGTTPTQTQAGTSTQASSIMPGLNMPSGWNIPGMPSQQNSTFTSLMAPVAEGIGKYVTGNITDWMKGPSTYGDLSPMMEGYAAKVLGGEGGKDIVDTLSSQFGKAPIAGTESGLGGFESLLGNAVGESTKDLSSGASGVLDGIGDMGPGVATAAIPMLGRMFGLKGDAANGLSAATSVGMAAAQGGLNPISDISAVMSLIKLFGGLFG